VPQLDGGMGRICEKLAMLTEADNHLIKLESSLQVVATLQLSRKSIAYH